MIILCYNSIFCDNNMHWKYLWLLQADYSCFRYWTCFLPGDFFPKFSKGDKYRKFTQKLDSMAFGRIFLLLSISENLHFFMYRSRGVSGWRWRLELRKVFSHLKTEQILSAINCLYIKMSTTCRLQFVDYMKVWISDSSVKWQKLLLVDKIFYIYFKTNYFILRFLLWFPAIFNFGSNIAALRYSSRNLYIENFV